MSWLRKAKVEGPTEIVKIPVIYNSIYAYDIARLKAGDEASWVMNLTVDQGGFEKEYTFRLVMEVR